MSSLAGWPWVWVRRAAWLMIAVGFLVLTGWVLVNAVLGSGEDLQRWAAWANIFGLPATVVGIAVLAMDRSVSAAARSVPPSGEEVRRAVEDLASRLDQDWSKEAVAREVTRPKPIRVRLSLTEYRSASRDVVFGVDRPIWEQNSSFADRDALPKALAAAFRGLKHGQWLVLGGPGAGKSVFCMLLTLGLLRSAPRAELPVLLPLNGWDPHLETVDTFVARRLARDLGRGT